MCAYSDWTLTFKFIQTAFVGVPDAEEIDLVVGIHELLPRENHLLKQIFLSFLSLKRGVCMSEETA